MAFSKKAFQRGLSSTLDYLAGSLRTERERKEKQRVDAEALSQKRSAETTELANKQTAEALNALRETPEGQNRLFERAGIASPGVETLRNRQFLEDALRYRKDQPEILTEAARGAGLPESIASLFAPSEYEKERTNRLKQQQETDRFIGANRAAHLQSLSAAARARAKQVTSKLNDKNLTYDQINDAIDNLENYSQVLDAQMERFNEIPDLAFTNPNTGVTEINPKYRATADEFRQTSEQIRRTIKSLSDLQVSKVLPDGGNGTGLPAAIQGRGYSGEGPPPPPGTAAAPFTQGNEIVIGGRRYRINARGQYDEVAPVGVPPATARSASPSPRKSISDLSDEELLKIIGQ